MKPTLTVAVAVSAGSLLCGCVVVDSQAHVNREEKRFTVAGAPELHLTTYDGAIEVHSADDAGTVIVSRLAPTYVVVVLWGTPSQFTTA